MIIAIPLAGGLLSEHFGHCEEFAFIEVDETKKTITKEAKQQPPEHEPGVLPRWLISNKTNVAIVGGMGMRARQMLEENGIRVIMGAPPKPAAELVREFLVGTLMDGDNTCGHGPDHVCDGDHKTGHAPKHPHVVLKK